jgi:hypothetical protein
MAVIFFCLSWKLSFGFLYYELCIYMMQSSEITVDLGCDLSCCSEIIISCTDTHTRYQHLLVDIKTGEVEIPELMKNHGNSVINIES